MRKVLLASSAKFCDTRGMHPNMDEEVRRLLEERRGDWRQISADASVSYSWISQFVRGLIPNPGFVTLKRLHNLLSEERRAA